MDRENILNPLWLKEESDDHPYVDIFSNQFHTISIDSVQSEVDDLFSNRQSKNNEKSKSFRMDGTKLFLEGKYYRALEKYNRSMCYAENGSEELILAISNRSSCYLRLKLFQQCLNDIEMIKRSKYPSRIHAKLNSRQAECLEYLTNDIVASGRIDNQKVELSFGEHNRYAGVADCLELQYSGKWGRHVTANRDLDVNETVMIENPFSFVGHDCSDLKYYRCSRCWKSLMNFIPCKECVGSMFCSTECMEEANKSRHQFECQREKVDTTECDCSEKECQMEFDLLWKINSSFETVYELMRTVEKMVNGNRNEINATCTNESLGGLEIILQLETNKEKQREVERLIRNAMRNYLIAMRLPQFRERFVSEGQKRFLKHLILHLLHIIKQAVLVSDLDVDVTIFRSAELRDYGVGLYPIASQLNHSCVPNVFCYSVDNRLICKVIRPIKSGDQLFRSYISGQIIMADDPNDPAIEASYYFLDMECKIEDCKCSYCSLRKSDPQALPDPWMPTGDPNYVKINSILTGEIEKFFQMSDKERQSYVDAAVAYLREHDAKHPSREIVVVQMYLQNYWMITTELCGEMKELK